LQLVARHILECRKRLEYVYGNWFHVRAGKSLADDNKYTSNSIMTKMQEMADYVLVGRKPLLLPQSHDGTMIICQNKKEPWCLSALVAKGPPCFILFR
jgi:hypothetical protein